MTWLEVNDLLEQLPIVSNIFNLKEYVGSFVIEDFVRGLDFDESESEEERLQNEFEVLQERCKKLGIKPPKRKI